jgi:L-threonylcarbamoyladenylate synthase
VLLVVGRHTLPSLPSDLHRFHLETPAIAARDLYVVLHQCDALNVDLVVVVPPPDRPEWSAIRDRLWRATHAAHR